MYKDAKMLITQLWHALTSLRTPVQAPISDGMANASSDRLNTQFPTFAFSEQWSVLGPFQIGTREAIYGADPLEYHGGFHALEYDKNATFRSSLAANGTISWSNLTAEVPVPGSDSATATLDVSFPNIEWQSLRDTYGWAALQWQAWARGNIFVQSEESVLLNLYTPGILEFWVDDAHHFGGDFYSFERVPTNLHLKPGIHRIDVRLVRDVRAMGGVGEPNIRTDLKLLQSWEALRPVVPMSQPLSGFLISDAIGNEQDAMLASPYASLTVRNDGIHEMVVKAVDVAEDGCFTKLTSEVRVVPGQTRPVRFRIKCVIPPPLFPTLQVKYTTQGGDEVSNLEIRTDIDIRSVEEPHKVTFSRPGGVTSYAILRPPSKKALDTMGHNNPLPVILALHGAGLEADSDAMRHALDALPDVAAWILIPTGGSPWSGDDWHAWGFADVEAAIAMIPEWIENVQWKANGVDIEKWLVVGHSNGGQGTWYTLTHRPDKIIAAAPLSGYSSIQNYVPYDLWRPSDPGRTAMLQSPLLPYRHELLLANAKSIPVLQQHGTADDNVPPYHSRLLSQLLVEAGAGSQYVEFPDMPHWWDDIFTTDPLRHFIETQLILANTTAPSRKLDDFSLVVANPGDTGSKHGVKIAQLAVPGQLGRLDVLHDLTTKACNLKTSNVKTFSLPKYFRDCSSIFVDGQELEALDNSGDLEGHVLCKENSAWQIRNRSTTTGTGHIRRSGRQLGAMDAILRSKGAFSIVQHTKSSATTHIALQISRNFNQYYFADTDITSDYTSALESTGNVISIALGNDLPAGFHKNYPIQIKDGIISIDTHRYPSATAALFLRPLPEDERLELVVWGSDAKGVALAARLVPLIPGSGQPDFLVADETMAWKGIEGLLAMGFLGEDWEVSENAFFA